MPRVGIGIGLGRGRGTAAPVGAPPLTLFEQVLALSSGLPQFTAGKPDNVILGGTLVSWRDWNDPAHFITQSNATFECLAPAAALDFNGKLVATFTGSQVYQSNRPAGAWDFAAQGISYEEHAVLATIAGGGNVYAATTFGAPSGTQSYWGFGAGFGVNLVGPGSVVQLPSFGAQVGGVPTHVAVRYRQAEFPQYRAYQNGLLQASGNFFTAPGLLAAQPMTLGANSWPTPGALPANMRFAYLGCFPALSDAQRLIVDQWVKDEYNIPDDGGG